MPLFATVPTLSPRFALARSWRRQAASGTVLAFALSFLAFLSFAFARLGIPAVLCCMTCAATNPARDSALSFAFSVAYVVQTFSTDCGVPNHTCTDVVGLNGFFDPANRFVSRM